MEEFRENEAQSIYVLNTIVDIIISDPLLEYMIAAIYAQAAKGGHGFQEDRQGWL